MGYVVMSTIRQTLRISPETNRKQGSGVLQDLTDAGTRTYIISETRHTTPAARELLVALYHWTMCLFISALVLAQIFGAVWNTVQTTRIVEYGRDPLHGGYQIVGTNDIPYADRVVACVRKGKFYEPRLVGSLLASGGDEVFLEDETGAARHGYRLVQRRNGSSSDSLDSTVYESYRGICNLISSTLDEILGACSALGYSNFTVDGLRVVGSANSTRLFRLTDSLPVLIMPYWDNTELARHAIPTWNGDACVFRLEDAYFGNSAANSSRASFRGINQSIRHDRTIEWLDRPGGVWRNGWYEDLQGDRWYSDVMSSNPGPPYYMAYRMYDMLTGLEMNCSKQEECLASPRLNHWGSKFTTFSYTRDIDSITILNGSAFGVFHFKANQVTTARIAYDWETLLSNTSVGLVLVRWIMTLLALHIGTIEGGLPCFGGGIGCLSGSSNFSFLVFSMLPQLRMTLAAFWTVGCRFQGQQAALANAWFTMYPAIAQCMIWYFSLINVLAKITRRRVSDALFGPSVVLLCLLHYYCSDLAASGLLEGVDGRIPTLVLSDEVKTMKLHQFFTSDLAWRMNGRVKLVFYAKVAVLGANLIPLIIVRPFIVPKRGALRGLQGIEKALALHITQVGGMGLSPMYLITQLDMVSNSSKNSILPSNPQRTLTSTSPRIYLNSFELVRLGYLVFGNKFLISFDTWDLLSAMAPLRSYCYLWNHRVCVWSLNEVGTSDGIVVTGFRTLQNLQPEMWRMDDDRLKRIPWWKVSSCAIQC